MSGLGESLAGSTRALLRRIYAGAVGLRGIARTSLLILLARLGAAACTLLLSLFLARTLEASELGEVMLGLSFCMLLSIFATLNYEAGSIRFVVQNLNGDRRSYALGFVLLGRRILLLAGLASPAIVFAAFFFYPAFAETPYATSLVIASLGLPLLGSLKLHGSYAHALSRFALDYIPKTFLRSFALLLGAIAAWLFVDRLDAKLILCVYVLVLAFLAAGQYLLLRRHLHSALTAEQPRFESRKWIVNGLWLAIPVMFTAYVNDLAILIASFSMTSAELGVLGVALRIVGPLQFAVFAVNLSIAPLLSRLLGEQDGAGVRRILAATSHLRVWPCLVVSLLIAFNSAPLLSLFGPEFLNGERALQILAFLPLALSVFGPVMPALAMSGEQRRAIPTFVLALLLLSLSIPLLGHFFGLAGCAAAIVLVTLFWSASLYLLIRRRLGFDTSILGGFKAGREEPAAG